jgi:hypothetical protein
VFRAPRRVLVLALAAGASVTATAHASTPAKVRTGGPSAPDDPKVAIVGSDRELADNRYVVLEGGQVVGAGRLNAAKGRPAPWAHAYAAP